ncbi:hypothetical protein AAFP30_02480 [Gordonia sp. CPCC 205515]|uniref:hypothetical protein n=1 Tax=Gordonia sp. CPCC 205515 TaxID=3140791 RepID=UPI003AF3F460
MRTHIRRRAAAAVTGIIVSATTIFGPVAAHASPGDQDTAAVVTAEMTSPAGRTIVDLLSDRPLRALDDVPPDFGDRFGYQPQARDGYPVNPAGACSSPVPLPGRFEKLCATHDFGYDLLRYAADRGHPLSGWARLRLDRQLVARMHAACSSPLCTATAVLAAAGLGVNTWRQYDGVPVRGESVGDLVVTSVTRAAAAVTARSGAQR